VNPLLLLKYLPYIAVAVFAAALIWYISHLKSQNQAITQQLLTEREIYASQRSKAAEEAASASEAYRAKEHDWAASAVKIQQDGEAKHAEVVADADRARKSAGSLRAALDIATKAIRSGAPSSSTSAADCTPAFKTADLLSELLKRASDRATALAGYADDASVAGQACERSYEALTR
jgi:hypothetical protein